VTSTTDNPTRETSLDDGPLWESALAGDGQAFGYLFDRHRQRVYRHAYRMASSRAEAEDVTATAFLELWRCRFKVRLTNDSILPWLLATTTNVGLNATRATRRYHAFLARLPRSEAVTDVAEHVAERDIHAPYRAALGSLARIDAQLFALVALEGFSVAEAGAELGLTASAAKSRMHRARHRLRDALGPDQLTADDTDGTDDKEAS